MADCSQCGGHEHAQISIALADGSTAVINLCTCCDARFWTRDGVVVPLEVVLTRLADGAGARDAPPAPSQLRRRRRPKCGRPVVASSDRISSGADDVAERVRRVLRGRGLSISYQPIVDLRCGGRLGFEALARFAGPPSGPDAWFADAAGVGLDAELESLAIEAALDALPWMPGGAYLSINASPAMVVSGRVKALLSGVAVDRVVLEITEHAPMPGYDVLGGALRPLRAAGLRVAVDDAGAGYASFSHILNLRPDVIKLDITITRDIDKDVGRQALASALRTFAGDTGSTVVAEGVETEAELGALRELGMGAAQGYHLGRPGPLPIRRDPLCSRSPGPDRRWAGAPRAPALLTTCRP